MSINGLIDKGQEVFRAYWFWKVVVSSVFNGLNSIIEGCMSCHHDNDNTWIEFFDLAEGFKAVHAGHVDV
ncbi:hypothetical protein D3C86_1987810 [compost metagenome]